MSRLSMLSVLALAAYLGSCAPGIDVPPAPNLEPVLTAYANPTATVTSDIMAAVADEIAKAAEEIEDSEILDELLDVITDVQQELDSATAVTCQGGANNGKTCTADEECPNGTCSGPTSLVLGGTCSGGSNDGSECAADGDCPEGSCAGGVTLPNPTGAFQINYVCPGWDERQFDEGYDDTPDSADGQIDLFMTLDSAGVGRVVWGTANNCQYLLPNEGDDCEAAGCSQGSYDGGVALDLGPDWVSEVDFQLPITFVFEGDIGLDGDDFRINQSFRVVVGVDSVLEILVDIGDPALSETFNYIFAGEAQAIRDASGTFGCSLEQSRCFNLICDGGGNAGSACITDANCPEGTCDDVTRFSW